MNVMAHIWAARALLPDLQAVDIEVSDDVGTRLGVSSELDEEVTVSAEDPGVQLRDERVIGEKDPAAARPPSAARR